MRVHCKLASDVVASRHANLSGLQMMQRHEGRLSEKQGTTHTLSLTRTESPESTIAPDRGVAADDLFFEELGGSGYHTAVPKMPVRERERERESSASGACGCKCRA